MEDGIMGNGMITKGRYKVCKAERPGWLSGHPSATNWLAIVQ